MDCVYYFRDRYYRPSTIIVAFNNDTALSAEDHPDKLREWVRQSGIIKIELSDGLIHKCLDNNQKVLAYQIYRDLHQCSWMEAVAMIDVIAQNRQEGNYAE